MEKLKRCPFMCGGKIDDLTIHEFEPCLFRIECEICSAHGPYSASEERAILLWNRRQAEKGD